MRGRSLARTRDCQEEEEEEEKEEEEEEKEGSGGCLSAKGVPPMASVAGVSRGSRMGGSPRVSPALPFSRA